MKKQRKKSANGQVTIIGGKWRGRKLPVLSSIGLRPTTNRIKETVFNWLTPYLSGSRCLDCYAGSGNLGFEAVSLGALHATLIEKKTILYNQLIASGNKLEPSSLTIINDDTLHYLATPAGQPFNIVFIDPPFTQNLVNKTATLLEKNHWLTENSLIYIENASGAEPLTLPANWLCYREKTAGQVRYRLYQRTASQTGIIKE